MRRLIFYSFLFLLFATSFFPEKVIASYTPDFPSCINPQGQMKVHYDKGVHGIAGDSNTYSGSDTVYTLSDATLMQCFCAENDHGIQTNWWEATSLSQADIKVLTMQNWIYIPDGVAWGLKHIPYLAQNIQYSCKKEKIAYIESAQIWNDPSQQLAGTGYQMILVCLAGGGLLALSINVLLKLRK